MNHDVVIIGAGFSGLRMAIKLKQAGITDFVVLEKTGQVVADYELKPFVRLNTEAVRCTFDPSMSRWIIDTASGHLLTARVLVVEQRPSHRPTIPPLPGLSTFEGTTFHPDRWDHSFDLKGKRIAVIGGTGAGRFVPRIARNAMRVLIFQRAPSWTRAFRYGLRPTIELVTHGIKEITEDAILTWDGVRHPADAIILATGCSIIDDRSTVEISGRDGLPLQEAWRTGETAYLGMAMTGFPNLFLVHSTDSGGGNRSILVMVEAQVRYIMACLRMMGRTDSKAMEVYPHVRAQYTPESSVNYWRHTRRPNPHHFSLTPFEDELDETHRGPAVVDSEGREIAVEVHLTGHLQPIDGSFRWYGRIARHPEVTALHEAGLNDITMRLPGSAARKARLTEIDPWGNARVTGTGQPPFPIP